MENPKGWLSGGRGHVSLFDTYFILYSLVLHKGTAYIRHSVMVCGYRANW